VGLLHRLGLHRAALQPPEPAVEVDRGLGPGRLHQPYALVETGDEAVRLDAERAHRPSRAGADADLDPAVAELVQRGDALGQVQPGRSRSVQAAAYVISSRGSMEGRRPMTCSWVQALSKPSSSARVRKARKAAGSKSPSAAS